MTQVAAFCITCIRNIIHKRDEFHCYNLLHFMYFLLCEYIQKRRGKWSFAKLQPRVACPSHLVLFRFLNNVLYPNLASSQIFTWLYVKRMAEFAFTIREFFTLLLLIYKRLVWQKSMILIVIWTLITALPVTIWTYI